MKILMIVYYGLTEALLSASNSLIDLNCEIGSFPLFRYYLDKYDRVNNYLELLINKVKEFQPDIILWWYFGIPTEDLKNVYEHDKDIRHMLFNWDDPYNWNLSNLEEKSKYFDTVFACSEDKLDD